MQLTFSVQQSVVGEFHSFMMFYVFYNPQTARLQTTSSLFTTIVKMYKIRLDRLVNPLCAYYNPLVTSLSLKNSFELKIEAFLWVENK